MNSFKNQILIFLLLNSFTFSQDFNSDHEADVNIDIGSGLELFVDYSLIDTLINTELKLHHPIDKGKVLEFDEQWEGPFSGYCTIIDNGQKFQLYYRGRPETGKDGGDDEVTCYAESEDGINWSKPELGLHEFSGNKNNNIILAGVAPITHNFSPFLDANKNADPNERYKALGGTSKSGLVALVSPDGIVWRKLQEKAVFKKGQFDSQNVSFWSEKENNYLCYFRTWTEHENKRYRTVSRTMSKDFVNWADPEEMSFGSSPREHIYTNQTFPYFRAPDIYISVAARFMPGRQVLSEEDALNLNVNPNYFKDCSDAVLMTSRGGNEYSRTFMEAFIRPGIGLQNWVSRSNYPVLNIVQTAPEEVSIYVNQDYAQPSAHIRRYTLRLDGFTSINASYSGGELVTKPFRFSGDSLFINYSTSAAGYIKVAILDTNGTPYNGFSQNDCAEIIGNEIKKLVTWKGISSIRKFSNELIRLKFVMKDSDLFSLIFKMKNSNKE